MNPTMKNLLAIGAMLLITGCAHSVRITPDSANLPTAEGITRSTKTVGYVMTDEERNRRVITPGGGGDKIEYAPYKELEAGLFRVLNNVFANVHPLRSVDEQSSIAEKGITLVFRPTIATNSSSSSLFTWPPTAFEVIIEIKAMDTGGKLLWADTISGKGNAEFAEFKSDFSLAAKRASEAALKQLQTRLLASSVVR
ncbi:MAG: hypothetical protein ACK499_10055 [Betaproteobacteria bacterium]|jgi:hypothetical protein